MSRRCIYFLFLLSFIVAMKPVIAADSVNRPKDNQVDCVLHLNQSPLISFRILFRTGSASDPAGKEGVAALTAAMLSQGGSKTLSYDQIVEAMYPMATSFGSQVDREMTVFTGTTHVDNLQRYYELISKMLLEPGFREDDFTRLKSEAINYLRVSLRENNDEELGKEHLYNVIYAGHPYGHHNVGTVSSLERLTLEDVRAFYRQHYTQRNLVIGLAGAYPPGFLDKVQADFTRLPLGNHNAKRFAEPKLAKGTEIDIVQRETRSTAISLGFPIQVKRGDKDWAALAVASSYLGQHRSMNGRLFQRLREVRGLNYGDYAYIEYFPRGMYQFEPDPNLARQQQIFQIWIRPVEPQNGHFALRAALFEYDKLVQEGLSKESFEATREFLTKNANILLQTQDARLGYAIDSQFYGIGEFNRYLRDELAKLTVEDVNRAIRKHLKTDTMRIVMITKDAEGLRSAILENKASPITYNSPKTQDILDEDKKIEALKVEVKPETVRVIPAARIFE